MTQLKFFILLIFYFIIQKENPKLLLQRNMNYYTLCGEMGVRQF